MRHVNEQTRMGRNLNKEADRAASTCWSFAANGTSTVAFWVTDCSGAPLGNSALAVASGGGSGPFAAQSLGFNFGAPNFWYLNAPNGAVIVNANLYGQSFGQTTFSTVAGQTTYVTITP
jgi:hypothetical protein